MHINIYKINISCPTLKFSCGFHLIILCSTLKKVVFKLKPNLLVLNHSLGNQMQSQYNMFRNAIRKHVWVCELFIGQCFRFSLSFSIHYHVLPCPLPKLCHGCVPIAIMFVARLTTDKPSPSQTSHVHKGTIMHTNLSNWT